MKQGKQQGFTIIEVVLVLAIAGLIFMVVFLALPGLQRSQRDTQRKQDVGRFISQLTTFQGNNKGSLPNFGQPSGDCNFNDSSGSSGTVGDDSVASDYCAFINKYLQAGGNNFNDPQTHSHYELVVASEPIGSITEVDSLGQIAYIIRGTCGPDGVINEEDPGSNHYASFAVNVKLENGYAYCQEG